MTYRYDDYDRKLKYIYYFMKNTYVKVDIVYMSVLYPGTFRVES